MSTYIQLQTDLKNWTMNIDIEDVLPFIISAGQRSLEETLVIPIFVDKDLPPAKIIHPAMREVELGNIPSASDNFSLPADYLSFLHLNLIDNTVKYEVTNIETAEAYVDKDITGLPKSFHRISNKFYFDVLTDKAYTYELSYIKRLTELSNTNTTNWWTDNIYTTLFYFCLVETIPFLGDDPRGTVWINKRNEEVNKIVKLYL